MQKIFTSILLLGAAFTAAAQNFTVTTPDGKTHADGDVINVGYEFDGECYDWLPELTVNVNKAASSITGKSAFTVTATASKSGFVKFCGLNDACDILKPTVTKSNTYAAGAKFPLSIDIVESYTMIPEAIETKIEITDGVQTLNLTVNFTTEQAGINAPATAANTVKFIGRTLHYSLDSATAITLYNISGRPVISRSLSGTGSLNLSSIPAGVYVYRCGLSTGKVVLH